MKKIFSAIMSSPLKGRLCGLLFALLVTTTLSAYDFQAGDLYYNITSSSAPYTVMVTYQVYRSSTNYSDLTTATIPENVTHNGITYSVTEIGEDAFRACKSLTSITIPNSVTSIGNLAFCVCSSLTSITIPNSVTSIGESAFSGCTSLTSITIPNSVTSIGRSAFSGCTSLTSITIPNSVTSIGRSAFSGCIFAKENFVNHSVLDAEENNYWGASIGDTEIDGLLIRNDTVIDCRQYVTSVIIPNSVTSIGDLAFYHCSSLTSITIPNSVTSIGNLAFSGCSSLTSVTIPNSVTSIGGSAFYSCSSLSSVTIGNSVTSIGVDAFKETEVYNNKSNWKNDVLYISNCLIEAKTTLSGAYTINDNTQLIGSRAFANCRSLTSIIIPNSVKGIGNEAFGGCWYITSLTIPNSVTNIGYGITAACPSLISIVVENGNMIYDSRENCNAIIETTTNILIAGCQNTIIPNSITGIGDLAFHACFTLTSITIPNSVTSIGREVFVLCESLTTVICKAIEVPKLGSNVFKDMPLSGATLYVRAQSLDDYKAADQWKDFGTILPTEEEAPEDEIELQDTEITIVFTNSKDNDSEIYSQSLTIKVPATPEIEGFTFLGWQPVATLITDTITIQAIYEANTPTSAEVYTNPANPVQKLLRNGQVYILQDGKTYTVMGQKL